MNNDSATILPASPGTLLLIPFHGEHGEFDGLVSERVLAWSIAKEPLDDAEDRYNAQPITFSGKRYECEGEEQDYGVEYPDGSCATYLGLFSNRAALLEAWREWYGEIQQPTGPAAA